MFVKNLSREEAKVEQPKSNSVWICMVDPDCGFYKSTLDVLPNIKLKFWDVERISAAHLWSKKKQGYEEVIMRPPTQEQIKEIFDFLMENIGKNVYVSCAAGIARSGAVAYFLNKHVAYYWEKNRDRAWPNKLIVNGLEEFYKSK